MVAPEPRQASAAMTMSMTTSTPSGHPVKEWLFSPLALLGMAQLEEHLP